MICNQIILLFLHFCVKLELEEQRSHKVVTVKSIEFDLLLLVSLQWQVWKWRLKSFIIYCLIKSSRWFSVWQVKRNPCLEKGFKFFQPLISMVANCTGRSKKKGTKKPTWVLTETGVAKLFKSHLYIFLWTSCIWEIFGKCKLFCNTPWNRGIVTK